MVSVAFCILLPCYIFWITRRGVETVDIVITGLIPSKLEASSEQDSGTTVLLYYGKRGDKVESGQKVKSGYADEKGEFRASVDKSKVGQTIICRIRHASFKFKDVSVPIMPYGAFYAAEMEPDGAYIGPYRGAEVGDLRSFYNKAIKSSNDYRNAAFNRLGQAEVRLSEIPFLFWFFCYFFSILAFL